MRLEIIKMGGGWYSLGRVKDGEILRDARFAPKMSFLEATTLMRFELAEGVW